MFNLSRIVFFLTVFIKAACIRQIAYYFRWIFNDVETVLSPFPYMSLAVLNFKSIVRGHHFSKTV